MCYHAANFQASGELPKRQGSGAAMIVPYRGYASKDGFIVIAAGNDKLFASLAQGARPSGMDRGSAVSHQSGPGEEPGGALSLDRGASSATRTSAEWQAILDAAGVPNAPMQTIAEVLDHPQTKALGMMQQSPAGDITLLGLPLSFDGARPAFRMSRRRSGAHTEEIFGATAPPQREKRA